MEVGQKNTQHSTNTQETLNILQTDRMKDSKRSGTPLLVPRRTCKLRRYFRMQILENNLVAVESLLKHHSDVINVNALGEEGLAPIHQSIILGYKQLLKILITKGNADVNIKDLKGWTPLHYSSNNGDIKCSKYLISKGANSFVYSDDHQLPIDVAKNVAMISFLSREIAKSGHVELEYFYLSKHGLLNNDDSSTKDLQVYNEVFLPSFAGDSDNNICRDSSSSSSNLSPNTLFLLYIEQNQYNFLDALLKRETVTILNSLDLNGLGECIGLQ